MTLLLSLLTAAALFSSPIDSSAVVCLPDATNLIKPEFQPLARMLSIEPGAIPTCGNSVHYIYAGKDYKDLLTKDLQDAKELIELELFLYGQDPDGQFVKGILYDKIKQGVEVRYTHDSFGNFFDNIFDGRKVFTGYYDDMPRNGMNVRNFSPILRIDPVYTYPGQRNHRKINIIDKHIAYTGGMNITEGSMSGWGDSHMRITGPAVQSLRSVLLKNWNDLAHGKSEREELVINTEPATSAGGTILQVVADGADMPANMTEEFIVWALDNAKEYVWFQTPYFGPTAPVLKAIKRAAERGLDVRLLIPSETDLPATNPAIRSFFKTCTDSGVKIIYRTGPFNHSKTFVCDDYLTWIGSSNLDGLSLKRLFEVNVLIYDEATALDNKRIFLEGSDGGTLVGEDLYSTWDGKEKFMQRLLRLATPWL